MPVELNTLFQSDPAAQELGLGFLNHERRLNEANIAQKMFETQKGLATLPYDIESKRLRNETTSAQLPGIRATSGKLEDDARFSRETLGSKIEAELKKYSGQMSDAQLKELTNAGQAYAQAGKLLENLPGPASHAAAKQILGQFYRPEFDQVPPHMLGKVVSFFGDEMINAQDKYVQQLGLLAGKTGSAERIAESKNATTLEAARIAAAAKIRAFDKDIIEAREAAKAKFGNYPQRAGYYISKAIEAAKEAANIEDPDVRKAMLERADLFEQIAQQAHIIDLAKPRQAAEEANRAKPALGAFDIPTVTPPGKTPGEGIVTPGNNPNVKPSTQTPTGSPELYKKAFGAYEPDVYEYRIGPNGNPQRRKKQ